MIAETCEERNGAEKMKGTTEWFTGLQNLFRLYDKLLKKVCMKYDLSLIEADVISFLRNNPQKDTAADIVELRMLSKGQYQRRWKCWYRGLCWSGFLTERTGGKFIFV